MVSFKYVPPFGTHALACIKVLLIYLFFVYRIVDNKVAKEFVMGRNLPNRLG